MAQTQIELTEQQLSALEKLAKQRQISLSDLIQEGIKNLLQPTGGPTPKGRKTRANASAEHFRSDVSDRSQDRDARVATDAEVRKEWAKKRAKHAPSLEQIHEISRKVRTNVTQAILEARKDA